MKVISILAIISFITSILFCGLLVRHDALYVIGGEYTIKKHESLNGNLYALFSDVTLEKGARISGDIVSLWSDVDVLGTIEGNTWSIKFFGYTIRIPKFIRFQIAY